MSTQVMSLQTTDMSTHVPKLQVHLTIAAWLMQLLAAGILLQTLFFKFTAAPESVYIFRMLGFEPYGRIAAGVAEAIAVVLLLIPRTAVLGAAFSLLVISGALMSHLTKLGVVVQGDGGLLFALACIVLACGLGVLMIRRFEIPIVGHWFAARAACPSRRALAKSLERG